MVPCRLSFLFPFFPRVPVTFVLQVSRSKLGLTHAPPTDKLAVRATPFGDESELKAESSQWPSPE